MKQLYHRKLMELGCAKGVTAKQPLAFHQVKIVFAGRKLHLAVIAHCNLRKCAL